MRENQIVIYADDPFIQTTIKLKPTRPHCKYLFFVIHVSDVNEKLERMGSQIGSFRLLSLLRLPENLHRLTKSPRAKTSDGVITIIKITTNNECIMFLVR